MSGGATPTEAPVLDERDLEPRTPMKRLGSTRKLAAFNHIKCQLSEQNRLLEGRAEAAAGVASELSEYCRRRAELENEYSRALDKLAKAATTKHKEQKHKRELWSLNGAFACWQAALESTRALARDHAALAAVYGGTLAARLQRAADDALRLHRKCKDIVVERHEEVGAALAEAAAAGKLHAARAADWRAAADKLRAAETARAALAAADPPRHKKLKALDKELEKRRTRYAEARTRALRARAEYVLAVEAANAGLQRYYLDDVADIMLCMEVGFEAVVGRALRTAGAAETARARAGERAARALQAAAETLDARRDNARLVRHHPAAFSAPAPLPLPGPPLEEGAGELAGELAARAAQLEAAARQLRAECVEAAKTLDAAEAELVRQMEGPARAWDAAAAPDADLPRREQEDYYLAKFREYVWCAGRVCRVEARAAAAAGAAGGAGARPRSPPPSPPRRAARRGAFTAPVSAALPAVLVSCVRVIASYGLRHQGIFRVSGSQVEMQALRAAFERGEDPLANVRDAQDINSVCGVLKMYLREIRPSLLGSLHSQLCSLAATDGVENGAGSGAASGATSEAERDAEEFLRRARRLLAQLPLPAMLLLRYLFAFLHHLTEYAAYNMMDAWNVAICLGPTLAPAPPEPLQLALQNHNNHLVKRLILHHQELFPQDVAPHTLYQRPPESEHENGVEGDGETEDGGGEEGSDERDAGEAEGETAGGGDDTDNNDDLSLYTDDNEEDGDTTSEEGDEAADEPGERSELAAATNRCGPQRLHPDQAPLPPVRSPPAPSTSAGLCRSGEVRPDLVLGLPAQTRADVFLHNHNTLKKRHKQSGSEESAEVRTESEEKREASDGGNEAEEVAGEELGAGQGEAGPGQGEAGAGPGGAGPAQGSPVPARNTARVAAKFADLTLTGGSLKPALAAKPALLRRPAPLTNPPVARDSL